MQQPQPEIEIIGPDGVPVGVVRRPPPRPDRIWLHIALFALTFLTTTVVGGYWAGATPNALHGANLAKLLLMPRQLAQLVLSRDVWTTGLMFSIPLLTILGSHELGHYLACRAHRLDATLPFFLPFPFGIGTLGAFIRIRTPLANKRELFDVGAAGPLTGFVVTIPFLIGGVLLSRPEAPEMHSGDVVYGLPLLLEWTIRALRPELLSLPAFDLHPVAAAAWFGLFATALNLLPFGQLDGGHVLYAMLGRVQRRYAWPALVILLLLGFRWPGWWLWLAIALAMGVRHPWIPDESEPLDPKRRLLGIACIVIFALSFMPQPIGILR